MEGGPHQLGLLPSEGRFVVERVLEGEGVGPYGPVELLLRKAEERAGVDASAQVGGDLHVRHQALSHISVISPRAS